MESQMSSKQISAPRAQLSSDMFGMFGPTMDYMIDAAQRTVLFCDVMRQRGNQYREHLAQTVPHVLDYEAELIIDGRTLERPVNYGLVRIVPPKGTVLDLTRRPFVIVDPRAGRIEVARREGDLVAAAGVLDPHLRPHQARAEDEHLHAGTSSASAGVEGPGSSSSPTTTLLPRMSSAPLSGFLPG